MAQPGTPKDRDSKIAQPTEPLDADGVAAFRWGTVMWVVAFAVLLITGSENTWWLWVCFAGIVIGVLGTIYSTRRRAVYAAAKRATSQE